MSEKRNRSGNFDQDDVELFLSLVNENKALIESGKQEDKHKGWNLIHEGFNDSCTGIKRDVSALKMKLKNLKAQNKKFKSESETALEPLDEESEQDTNGMFTIERKPRSTNTRKRGRIFTNEECLLLQELVEKHFNPLDTSLTRTSLDQRNRAWDAITEEYNNAKLGIQRDLMELKIKHKNMKAQRQYFKSEVDTGAKTVVESYVEQLSSTDDNTPERKLRSKPLNESIISNPTKTVSPIQRLQRPTRVAATRPKSKVFDSILDDLDVDFDSDSEDEYVPPIRNQPCTSRSDDKEAERIRKENLLLKNAVLRKKERLLELQIALAERNLRRHQF